MQYKPKGRAGFFLHSLYLVKLWGRDRKCQVGWPSGACNADLFWIAKLGWHNDPTTQRKLINCIVSIHGSDPLTIPGIGRHKDGKWERMGCLGRASIRNLAPVLPERKNGESERERERESDQFCSENKSLPRQRVPRLYEVAARTAFLFFPSVNPAECRRDLSSRLLGKEMHFCRIFNCVI